ncbi:hypothetical protein BSPWISOXPB_2281, partial [uncultured Gammaproteobacteria bacterium]
EKRLTDKFIRYKNFNVIKTWLKDQFDNRKIDAVSGATVTDRIIDDSVLHTVLKFAKKINLSGFANNFSNSKVGTINKIYLSRKKVGSNCYLLALFPIAQLVLEMLMHNI